MLVSKKAYTMQENGQVTLPVEFRKKYNLKKGDLLIMKETEHGLLISPKEGLVMKMLDEIGAALKEKGITLEELMESGAEIREQLIREQYGLTDKHE